MRTLTANLAALALILATPALAQDGPQIEEIRSTWAACTEMLDTAPDDWTGWRRNFDGGYSDHFEFHDGGDAVSVLRQTWLIDAIAIGIDTSCFRRDGTLAFIYSELTSPNMAPGADGPSITREGRLYFAPDGRLIRVLRRITQEGKEVAPGDNDKYQLARGCDLTAPHPTVEDVRDHLTAELGDIEGNKAEYRPEPLDWCSIELD